MLPSSNKVPEPVGVESEKPPLVLPNEKPPGESAANELPASNENPVESDNNVKDFSELVGV